MKQYIAPASQVTYDAAIKCIVADGYASIESIEAIEDVVATVLDASGRDEPWIDLLDAANYALEECSISVFEGTTGAYPELSTLCMVARRFLDDWAEDNLRQTGDATVAGDPDADSLHADIDAEREAELADDQRM